MANAEFGGQDEADVQPAEQVAPVSPEATTPDQELEAPLPGLGEAFGALRNEEVGKPIAVGEIGEDGKPTQDTKFVGHILQTDGPNWHVAILDNGFTLTLGRQHGNTQEYGANYTGSEPLYFPTGTKKTDVFKSMVQSAGRNGAAVYATTQDPTKMDEIMGKVDTAVNEARHIIKSRRDTREQIGQKTVQAINAALNPDSRPSQQG